MLRPSRTYIRRHYRDVTAKKYEDYNLVPLETQWLIKSNVHSCMVRIVRFYRKSLWRARVLASVAYNSAEVLFEDPKPPSKKRGIAKYPIPKGASRHPLFNSVFINNNMYQTEDKVLRSSYDSNEGCHVLHVRMSKKNEIAIKIIMDKPHEEIFPVVTEVSKKDIEAFKLCPVPAPNKSSSFFSPKKEDPPMKRQKTPEPESPVASANLFPVKKASPKLVFEELENDPYHAMRLHCTTDAGELFNRSYSDDEISFCENC